MGYGIMAHYTWFWSTQSRFDSLYPNKNKKKKNKKYFFNSKAFHIFAMLKNMIFDITETKSMY